jgi:hypothetical protein
MFQIFKNNYVFLNEQIVYENKPVKQYKNTIITNIILYMKIYLR